VEIKKLGKRCHLLNKYEGATVKLQDNKFRRCKKAVSLLDGLRVWTKTQDC